MKAIREIETVGRQTLLAGTGVLGQSLDIATNKLDKLYVNGNAFVCELVSKGEAVELQFKAKLNNRFKGKVMLENKIAMLKEKLGMNNRGRDIQLEKLSTKVDNLIEVVAKLAQQKAAEQVKAKPAASKTATASKTAASKTAAVSKPAASKTAAVKKAPAKPSASKTTAAKKADDKA